VNVKSGSISVALAAGILAASGLWGVACDSRAASESAVPFGTVGSTSDGGTATAKKVTNATTFDEFPVVWLGTSYDSDGDGVGDMRLSSAYAVHGPAFTNPIDGTIISPQLTWFTLGYGTCKIPDGKESCNVPLNIDVDPPGDPRDEVALSQARDEDHLTVRGADAIVSEGRILWIFAEEFTVRISPVAQPPPGQSRLDQALRVASLLVGANPKGSWITTGTDFHPKAGSAVSTGPAGNGTPQPLPGTPAANGQATAAPPIDGPGLSMSAAALTGGALQLSVMSTPSNGATYEGFNIHVRWDPDAFAFASANHEGSVLPSLLCAEPVVDSDGGGVTYGCLTTGATTAATGLLGTIVLTPLGAGCSTLHLVTLGPPDDGDDVSGTYFLAPGGYELPAAEYVDARIDGDGQPC
jgi:hypothetical protein